ESPGFDGFSEDESEVVAATGAGVQVAVTVIEAWLALHLTIVLSASRTTGSVPVPPMPPLSYLAPAHS
uniref:hypothetical protein n=1 Tax=Stenotrophomonas maltophilia TaxID=40324 RepID=UPI001954ED4A